ncbi:MAG: hypothetical protein Ct9H300mP13_7800 [Gammaproteobacteria bacterium]|nr:MAG: hypothetical protein Ct9H300mP13_7800 [Gammaproteobacteria bacterium]
MSVEGNLQPLMANLIYIKQVLAMPGFVDGGVMSALLEPTIGRYLSLDLDGGKHRLYFEEAAKAFRWFVCTRRVRIRVNTVRFSPIPR